MFSFDRLKIHQIPIWENQHRIKYLTEYRDLLNTAFRWSRETGETIDLEQQRPEINKCKPLVHRMITLTGIKTVRQCARSDVRSTIQLDVIDELWSLEQLFVSSREPMVAIEEAIGEYERDQKKARWRTWYPFFWLAWGAESIVEAFIQIIGWIAEIPIRLLSRIFRLDQEKAVRAWYGRLLTGLSVIFGLIFGLIQTLRALNLLDRWDSFLQAITHH